jgi:guanylate kinase
MKQTTKKTIVTITGATCSGKSTLAQYLAGRGIPEVRSFTTRDQRPGEVDGQHYNFMKRRDVEAIPKDQIIELVEFKGNLYGNTVSQMEEAWAKGRGVATVVVEPNGVLHWSAAALQHGFNHYSIYLDQQPKTLVQRFADRLKAVAPHQMPFELERMTNMLQVELPNWPKAFDYDLVVPNLGASVIYSEITAEMILGFLTIAFGQR